MFVDCSFYNRFYYFSFCSFWMFKIIQLLPHLPNLENRWDWWMGHYMFAQQRLQSHNSGWEEYADKYFSYFSTKRCCGYSLEASLIGFAIHQTCCGYSLELPLLQDICFGTRKLLPWTCSEQIVSGEVQDQWSCTSPETICSEQVHGNNFLVPHLRLFVLSNFMVTIFF